MTASLTVAPLPSVSSMQVDPSDARKRRREILSTQRTVESDGIASLLTSLPPVKKHKQVVVSSDDESDVGKSCKKPQMKYDPEVPMSKEQATVWRREQRRKRNRESAAASRQRQRDRINELEDELDGWKNKYEAVMAKIRDLEGQGEPQANAVKQEAIPLEEGPARTETPEPQVQSGSSGNNSPTSSTFLDIAGEGPKFPRDELQQPKPLKMISRPAAS